MKIIRSQIKNINLSEDDIEKLNGHIICNPMDIPLDSFVRYINKEKKLSGGRIKERFPETQQIKFCNDRDKKQPVYWLVKTKDIIAFRQIQMIDKYVICLKIINDNIK